MDKTKFYDLDYINIIKKINKSYIYKNSLIKIFNCASKLGSHNIWINSRVLLGL